MDHPQGNLKSVAKKLIKTFPGLYILFTRKNGNFKNALINLKGYNYIKNNNLFDISYYLTNNPDVKLSNMDPLIHYIYYGFYESRQPNPSFDGDYYLNTYVDVKNSGFNPLVHYSLYGIKEGRKTQKEVEIFGKILTDKDTSTIPDYTHLKKTLKGKNGYLFLINDSNNEIKQHFDESYTSNFYASIFIENLNLKKEFINKNKIRYYCFIIPDKSVVCKDFLPFEIKTVKRNYDMQKEILETIIPDFIEKLDPSCYFKSDSHVNYLGGKELSFYYLNHIDENFNREIFNQLFNKQISVTISEYDGDLTLNNQWSNNWSYTEEEKKNYQNEKITVYINEYLVNFSEDIPEEFKFVGIRETEYYKNNQGWTDLRVLILRDSSTDRLKDVISIYFKEILLYWDHGIFYGFNKRIVEWYKPDIILDIRTERFLENMFHEFK